jgi:transposase InsO family protein
LATTTGLPVKSVICDNAKELTSQTLQNFYEQNGITGLTTAPYSSSQNGHAERALGTIQNAVRAALSHPEMPPRYWDYAALDAITKGNTQPSPLTNDVPYNTFHKTPLSTINNFLLFGQWGYVTNTLPQKETLDMRAFL